MLMLLSVFYLFHTAFTTVQYIHTRNEFHLCLQSIFKEFLVFLIPAEGKPRVSRTAREQLGLLQCIGIISTVASVELVYNMHTIGIGIAICLLDKLDGTPIRTDMHIDVTGFNTHVTSFRRRGRQFNTWGGGGGGMVFS